MTISPNEIWNEKRHLSQAEFAGKCVATAFIMPLKIATLNYIPAPFTFAKYWVPAKALELRVRILASTLNDVISDTSLSCNGIHEGLPLWHKKYSLSELARFGFIDRDQANEITQLTKEYKDQIKVEKTFKGKFRDLQKVSNNNRLDLMFLNAYKRKYRAARANRESIEQTWIKFRDKELSARLPNPQVP